MKRKFNFYCLLLLSALVLSFVANIRNITYEMRLGAHDAMEKSEADRRNGEQWIITRLDLQQQDLDKWPYTLRNTQTGHIDSLQITQARIKSKVSTERIFPRVLSVVGIGFIAVVGILAIIAFIVIFVRLLLAVNRGEDFSKTMTWRIRILGKLLLLFFACDILFSLLMGLDSLQYAGYKVRLSGSPDFDSFIIGSGLLLFSHLFAIGQKMKEDQELTI